MAMQPSQLELLLRGVEWEEIVDKLQAKDCLSELGRKHPEQVAELILETKKAHESSPPLPGATTMNLVTIALAHSPYLNKTAKRLHNPHYTGD